MNREVIHLQQRSTFSGDNPQMSLLSLSYDVTHAVEKMWIADLLLEENARNDSLLHAE